MNLQRDAAVIRQQSEQWLTDTCTIEHFAGHTVTDGEYATSYTTESGVPCRMINRSGRLTTNMAGQSEEVQLQVSSTSFRIQLPYSTSLSLSDKIVYSGTRFDLVVVPVKHSLMGAFIVDVERTQ
jgi:hypothetical protein